MSPDVIAAGLQIKPLLRDSAPSLQMWVGQVCGRNWENGFDQCENPVVTFEQHWTRFSGEYVSYLIVTVESGVCFFREPEALSPGDASEVP